MMHHGHEEAFHNRPHSHVMFHHVESACAADVEKFCDVQGGASPQSTGDPFLDWIFLPFAPPPPEIRDLGMILDRLFDPRFLEPSLEHVTFFFVEQPHHEAPHFLIDSAAAKVAKEREPEEIPQLAHDLQRYGNNMLKQFDEDSSFHYKMARRLSEMDAKTIQHHVKLPFGCAKNQCLRRALVEGKLSKECQSNIERLEATFILEAQLEQRQALFYGMMLVYLCTLVILAIMVHRKMGSLRSNRRLGEQILHAVYNNPATRRQVELDLGHSVGTVPPVLRRAFDPNCRERGFGFVKRAKAAVFLVLIALLIFAPFWVLPVCIMLSVLRVIRLCRLPTQSSDCTYGCCCGKCLPTTDDCTLPCDVKSRIVTGQGEKHVFPAKNEVFCGVPLQIV
jgi:hypothetical protein